MLFTPEERNKIAGEIAIAMGRILKQEWKEIDGKWWLFTLGKQMRVLTDEEVQWHVARKHAPFVENGDLLRRSALVG